MIRIRSCESGDGHGSYDYRAENPSSTASGAWQIIDGTWGGYGGYHHASSAPRDVQDARAMQIYRESGTRPWNASRRCWS